MAKPVAGWTRKALLVGSGFAVVAALQLYVGTEDTDRFFAWTIHPPLTAAFLGACYWSAVALLFLSSRERVWAAARVPLTSGFVLVTLLLIVTLVHLDRFHLDSESVLTVSGTWAFISAYIVLPPVFLAAILYQRRIRGVDPPRTAPLPGWARALLALHALVLLAVGIALFAAPVSAAAIWPWPLTPLTGRAVAAWLLATGVAAALAVYERDWRRLRVPLVSYTVLAALQLGALARYSGTPEWATPETWLYVVFIVSMLAFGLYGAIAARAADPWPAGSEDASASAGEAAARAEVT